MGPFEIESLRAKLQQAHIDHVRVEIDLAITLLDLSRVEYQIQNAEAGEASFVHAQRALAGARKALNHIESPTQRAVLEVEINKAENAVQQFDGSARNP